MIVIISFSTLLVLLYSVMLLTFNIGWRRVSSNVPLKKGTWPFVSVVIPFRDEEAHLTSLLSDLQSQTYDRDLFEVLLINDHSVDDSPQIVQQFIRDTPLNIRLIHSDIEGKKHAIACGVSSSGGEIICQADADVSLPREWIRSMMSHFNESTGVVAGPVAMLPAKGFWSQFAALEFMSLQASGAALAKLGKSIMASAANLAFRKSLWEQCHAEGSDRDSGDDVFLIQAAARSEWEVRFNDDPQAVVNTPAPLGLEELIVQRARWGAKTPSYKSMLAKGIALLVAMYSVWSVVLLFAGVFSPAILQLFAVFIATKALWDYFFLKSYSKAMKQEGLMKYFASAVLIYPFYIVITLGSILFIPKRWKGRAIR